MSSLNVHLNDLPTDIKFLDLSERELIEVPDLTRFTQLIELNISKNNIKKFDGKKLPQNLQILRCFSCNIEVLDNLPIGLKKLNCSFNKLYYLSLNNELEEIDLRSNNLSFINNVENCENLNIFPLEVLEVIGNYRNAEKKYYTPNSVIFSNNVFFSFNNKIIKFKHLFYSLKFKNSMLKWFHKANNY